MVKNIVMHKLLGFKFCVFYWVFNQLNGLLIKVLFFVNSWADKLSQCQLAAS